MAAIRRNIVQNPGVAQAFAAGIQLLKQESSGISSSDIGIPPRAGQSNQNLSTYDLFVVWHVMAMNEMTPANSMSGRNAAHMGPAFLPWHRWLMVLLEIQFQRVLNDVNFGLPYWDWAADGEFPVADQADLPLWTAAFIGGDGRQSDMEVFTGPFRRTDYFRVRVESDNMGRMFATNRPLRRSLGDRLSPAFRRIDSLPTESDVAVAINEQRYDVSPWTSTVTSGLRNLLEGWEPRSNAPLLHNRVHVWVGGDMGPGSSPNDPVFFLNHCNVDRLWAAWQNLPGPRTYAPASSAPQSLFRHRRNDPLHSVLTSIQPTPGDMQDINNFYSYDNLSF